MIRSPLLPFVLLVALSIEGVVSSPVAAQATAPQGDAVLAAAKSPTLVSGKSPALAGLLEWVLPSAGYAYAGNWKRGLVPTAARVGGLVLVFQDQFTIFGEPPPCEGACVAGWILAGAGTLWAVLDAPAEARRHNERTGVAASIRITPDFGPNGAGVGVRIPFGN